MAPLYPGRPDSPKIPKEHMDALEKLPKDENGKPILGHLETTNNPRLTLYKKWNGGCNYLVDGHAVGSYLYNGLFASDTDIPGGEYLWLSEPESLDKEHTVISKKMPGISFHKPTIVSKEVFFELLKMELED